MPQKEAPVNNSNTPPPPKEIIQASGEIGGRLKKLEVHLNEVFGRLKKVRNVGKDKI